MVNNSKSTIPSAGKGAGQFEIVHLQEEWLINYTFSMGVCIYAKQKKRVWILIAFTEVNVWQQVHSSKCQATMKSIYIRDIIVWVSDNMKSS